MLPEEYLLRKWLGDDTYFVSEGRSSASVAVSNDGLDVSVARVNSMVFIEDELLLIHSGCLLDLDPLGLEMLDI